MDGRESQHWRWAVSEMQRKKENKKEIDGMMSGGWLGLENSWEKVLGRIWGYCMQGMRSRVKTLVKFEKAQ